MDIEPLHSSTAKLTEDCVGIERTIAMQRSSYGLRDLILMRPSSVALISKQIVFAEGLDLNETADVR